MASSTPRIALVDDDRFDAHRPPDEAAGHPERPARLAAARRGARRGADRVAAELVPVPTVRAARETLSRVHAPWYLDALEAAVARIAPGFLDGDTYANESTWDAALRAAGGAAAMTARLLEPDGPRRGVALLRPPGHHATRSSAMGFCLLNNVAVAAAEALERGVERVAIVDWDVHHGNGTEAIFADDPRVFFASIHQSPLYPGTGAAGDVGTGPGRGATLNVPLPPGTDSAGWAEAFTELVLPLVRGHEPGLVLVSCGFDGDRRDPLSEMDVEPALFGALTTALLGALDDMAPVGVILEGGYDLEAVEEGTRAVVEALGGATASPITEPVHAATRTALDDAREARGRALDRRS